MMHSRSGEIGLLVGLCLLLMLLVGGNLFGHSTPAATAATGHGDSGGHSSAHGGNLQPVGNRHAEAVLEGGRRVHLYLLDTDPSQLLSLATPSLQAEIQADGAAAATPLALQPRPVPGEPAGAASCFAAALPRALWDTPLNLMVTLPLDNRLYRVRFALGQAGHDLPGAGMPPPVPKAGEAQLFLTPGGKYTEADIAANGRAVPSVVFRNFVPSHDMHPRSGDRVCPITATKASPQCSWTIGGERYEFCCPPCLDEFMKRAKEHPSQIRPAASYVQK